MSWISRIQPRLCVLATSLRGDCHGVPGYQERGSDATVPDSQEAQLRAINSRLDAGRANGPIDSLMIHQVANITTLFFGYNERQEERDLVKGTEFQKSLLKAGKPSKLRCLLLSTPNSVMRAICTIASHPINGVTNCLP